MKVAILDHGLNLELAFSLAREGYEVGYFCEWRGAFPESARNSIGEGFEEFERIGDLDEALDFSDTIICPDTHSDAWVQIARKLGKNVFGAGLSEMAEQDRSYFKNLLKRMQLPVNPYVDLEGTEALETFLRAHKDRYVKLDGEYRGDFETCHHADWETTRDEWWGSLLRRLGANSQDCPFLVEEPIKSECEIGVDQIVMDGQYLNPKLLGYEGKDACYLGVVVDKLPPKMEEINAKFAPMFREWKARTFQSTENRVTKDGTFFYTDITNRCPHPPFAVESQIFDNVGKAVVEAAAGRAVKLAARAKYGAALLVKSHDLDDGWVRNLKIPKELRPLVKLQNAVRRNGRISIIPKSFIACTAIGMGSTIKEARKQAEDVARAVDCPGKSVDFEAMRVICEETVENGEKFGIHF